PHVEDDAVVVEPFRRGTLRLYLADGVETGRERTLDGGQRVNPTLIVPKWRQVSYLCHRDQPLVRRVLRCDAAQQIHVLVGRGKASQVEMLQPAQLQPLRDKRMEAADEPLLGQARRRWPEREVVM